MANDKDKIEAINSLIKEKLEHYEHWKVHFENISWQDYKPYMKDVIENHKSCIGLLEYLKFKIEDILNESKTI